MSAPKRPLLLAWIVTIGALVVAVRTLATWSIEAYTGSTPYWVYLVLLGCLVTTALVWLFIILRVYGNRTNSDKT